MFTTVVLFPLFPSVVIIAAANYSTVSVEHYDTGLSQCKTLFLRAVRPRMLLKCWKKALFKADR